MRVAAVDIGTNSTRLLVTSSEEGEVERRMVVTRLGEGVDASGRLAPGAIGRTLDVLADYARVARSAGVARLRATATSAARDAANTGDFFVPAAALLGVTPEVISGIDEAGLSFLGATAELDPADGPFLVADVGGGSTEFVLGHETPEALVSVDVGCVRVTERFLGSDPPSPAELSAARGAVDAELDRVEAAVPVARARRLVGLAGTVTTVAAYVLGLAERDAARTHHAVLSVAEVDAAYRELAAMGVGERRGCLVDPGRADVVVGGALLFVEIMRRFDFGEVLVSEHDILDGVAARLLALGVP